MSLLVIFLASATAAAAPLGNLLDPAASPAAPGNGKGGGNGGGGGGGGGNCNTAYPASMTGLGDSITQSANSDGLGDKPHHSWTYGYESGDGIESHYERLLALNPCIKDNRYEYAVSGADMADLNGQAQNAVGAGVEYVTILMGANDVCTSDVSTMTDPATFETQLRAGVDTLTAGLPAATVYVLSIPDVYQLWDIYHTSSTARWYWNWFSICQSLLDDDNTEEDRQAVRQRNIELNQVLEAVVTETAAAGYDWHWDGWATFDYQFSREDVSTVDYFHPSNTGQSNLAAHSWALGPFAS